MKKRMRMYFEYVYYCAIAGRFSKVELLYTFMEGSGRGVVMDHLTIFIYNPIVPDPDGIINQGQGNRTARAIQVHRGETINQRALLDLVQAIIAHNRASGWRKLKGKQ